jgi:hypothetical protein
MTTQRLNRSIWTRLAVVAVFAAAMAFVESAVVVYLRSVFHTTGGLVAYAPGPKDIWFSIPYFTLLKQSTLVSVMPQPQIAYVEVVREAATIVMLLCVGWLGGRDLRSRAALFLCAFGVWDIGYYAFLRVVIGWPASLADLDVLFLIPGPWVAPVFIPVAISVAMVVGGVLLLRAGWSARGRQLGDAGTIRPPRSPLRGGR